MDNTKEGDQQMLDSPLTLKSPMFKVIAKDLIYVRVQGI